MSDELDLAQVILARTREGKLEWERLSTGGYSAKVGNSTIVIDRRGSDILLRLANDEGMVVETLAASDRRDRIIEEIYELARRQALKVDETLSKIKRTLENL